MKIDEEIYDSLTKEIETFEKVYAMLGMAMKAGKVVSGEFSTEKSVKGGQAQLVIVSEDASDNTKKCFPTCVSFIRCQDAFAALRKNLGVRLEKRCALLSQLRRKALRKQSWRNWKPGWKRD